MSPRSGRLKIARNDERGEAITFPLMMQKVASDDPNEITFYGHAKGVKYEPNVPLPVKRWAEVQYRVALDDWLTIRVDSDWHACASCCVSRLWAELTPQYCTQQKVSGEWGGIGVVIWTVRRRGIG